MSRSDSELSDLEMLSDWEDTSDEEHGINRRNYKVRIDHFNILDSYEFQLRFRLDKTSVQRLLNEIYPHVRVKGARNYGIHPLQQLLLTLRFFALGTMLLSMADFAGVSKASACRIVRDISYAIAQLYNKYIYMRADTEQEFFTIARFPRVLGALDGTHIRIQSPCSQIGEEFRNRKSYFSINVQAVCNANLLFMNVVARWPGSAHDATIFNNSELRAQCESGMYGNKWLLADSAYPLKPYILTPLLNPQTRGEQLYNEAHIRTRNCIERCFGVWKRRFPVVALPMRLSLAKVNAVIVATAVLHNICRLNSLDDIPPEVEIPTESVVPVPNSTEEPDYTERATLISNFFNNRLGYGTGVNVMQLVRSPRAGQIRSPWAVKMINKRIKPCNVYSERLQAEAALLKRMSHPNIVGFRAFSKDKILYLGMEACDLSLGDKIEKRAEDDGEPFSAKQMLKVAADIGNALDFLHTTMQILHGDLKSYNILVNGDFLICKLCDFGVTLPLDENGVFDKEKAGKAVYFGTEAWSAPEVIHGGQISTKTDIWSFGLTIWEMMSLTPPHSQDETMDSMEMNDSAESGEDWFCERYGTRPPVPVNITVEQYAEPLAIFQCCTEALPAMRPSARHLAIAAADMMTKH